MTKKDLLRRVMGVITLISPALNTRLWFMLLFKRRINLKNPKTLDEKIQKMKLTIYKDNPIYGQCADKYRVRDYICSCGCPEILNDLYQVYDRVDDIDWANLPNSFVIKWNFGCGQNLIVTDKSSLDIESAKAKLKKWYKEKNFYLYYSELQYKNIRPKLLVEKLIETEDGNLPIDYKLYCFNGNPDCVLVCTERGKGKTPKFLFFDENGKILRYNKYGMTKNEQYVLDPIPENYNQLFDYARKITKGFPFVRADFYLEKGKVIFGELTFTPCFGMDTNRLLETQILFGNKTNI